MAARAKKIKWFKMNGVCLWIFNGRDGFWIINLDWVFNWMVIATLIAFAVSL